MYFHELETTSNEHYGTMWHVAMPDPARPGVVLLEGCNHAIGRRQERDANDRIVVWVPPWSIGATGKEQW